MRHGCIGLYLCWIIATKIGPLHFRWRKHYLVVPEVLHLARELRVPAGGDREVADAGRKRWQGIDVSIDDVIWIRPSRIKQQDKVKKLVNPAWTLENLFNYQLSLTLSDSLSL